MSNKKYQELEKLSENKEKILEIIEVLKFLAGEGIYLGEWKDGNHWLAPISGGGQERTEAIVAKFYGIDWKKVEQERLELEREIRS